MSDDKREPSEKAKRIAFLTQKRYEHVAIGLPICTTIEKIIDTYRTRKTKVTDWLSIQIDAAIRQAVEEEREKWVEALIWCSGSQDFSPGGQAREGWLKICQPLLDSAQQRKEGE